MYGVFPVQSLVSEMQNVLCREIGRITISLSPGETPAGLRPLSSHLDLPARSRQSTMTKRSLWEEFICAYGFIDVRVYHGREAKLQAAGLVAGAGRKLGEHFSDASTK